MDERYAGKLIVFEGIDGSGKSTQADMLYQRLDREGQHSVLLSEPTRTGHGKTIRDSFTGERFSPEEELRLFTLDRKDDLRNNILPVLLRGDIVVLDRYYYSTAAYQGARGLDWKTILCDQELFVYRPDILFLVDIPVTTAIERIRSARGGGNSFEAADYLERVRSLFLSMRYEYLHVLSGERPAADLADDIYGIIAGIL
ncbi:MAG: dTMP kinase [Spirochaetota bacterium]